MIPLEGKNMSLNLVSPGVKVREVDLTIGRVDAVNELVGAIAGPFEKGPINTKRSKIFLKRLVSLFQLTRNMSIG